MAVTYWCNPDRGHQSFIAGTVVEAQPSANKPGCDLGNQGSLSRMHLPAATFATLEPNPDWENRPWSPNSKRAGVPAGRRAGTTCSTRPPTGHSTESRHWQPVFFDVPIAIVSTPDEDRTWFKSQHGITSEKLPATRCYALSPFAL